MRNHTTHPQGRDSHNLNKYIWRFLALSAGESQIIHVTAWTEREARNRCPSGCVAVFAARIRQGGNLCTIKPHRTQQKKQCKY
ncbi:host cell division inhibitor Icd-like protein [Escherichia coli]|nr:host cell division inhibitor Icd-like protein [Escherichia coli]EKB2056778.1 host cell division inhibitor Icd-like protein [Escherichia coli]